MQTFDGKSGIIFDSMNEEWKWNPSGEIGKDFIRTNVTDCQGKTFKIHQASISHRCKWQMLMTDAEDCHQHLKIVINIK